MQNSNRPGDAAEVEGNAPDAGQDVKEAASPSYTERLEQQVRNEHDMYLRALADFDNYRRRVDRDRATAAQTGKRDIILAMIEALDGFDRALRQMGDAPPGVIDGLMAIQRRLLSVLEAQGVTPFNSVGERFNPELHEAVAAAQGDAHQPGEVVEEIQRGYRWGDNVLRPASVRVAQ